MHSYMYNSFKHALLLIASYIIHNVWIIDIQGICSLNVKNILVECITTTSYGRERARKIVCCLVDNVHVCWMLIPYLIMSTVTVEYHIAISDFNRLRGDCQETCWSGQTAVCGHWYIPPGYMGQSTIQTPSWQYIVLEKTQAMYNNSES